MPKSTTVQITVEIRDLDNLSQAIHDLQQDRIDTLATAEDREFALELVADVQSLHRLWNVSMDAEERGKALTKNLPKAS